MIGVIGCGNMAQAIVKGIHREFPEVKFFTYTPSFTRAHELAEKVKGVAVRKLSELQGCKTLIIACKPQQFKELATELTRELKLADKHIISIMAAVPAESISRELACPMVTRVMPNTPALIGEGVSLVYHLPAVQAEQKDQVGQYFSACSSVQLLEDEKSFDLVTTVTGSGPAYVYFFAKTMEDALKAWGVEAKSARIMVTQLFKGSALLMEENAQTPLSDLLGAVTSKGGVTIEAIKVFQQAKLEEITRIALQAAAYRSEELKKSLS